MPSSADFVSSYRKGMKVGDWFIMLGVKYVLYSIDYESKLVYYRVS